jgi:hypothetical protein
VRRLTAALALASFALFGSAACKRKPKRAALTAATDTAAKGPAVMAGVADPNVAPQLLTGFYDVEGNAWRWTAGKFAISLRTPTGAAQNGATLVLDGALPSAEFEQTGPLTLTAAVNGDALPPQRYTQGGDITYSRDVPASALQKSPATVMFTLDKTYNPGGADRRELGLVVRSIGFEAK